MMIIYKKIFILLLISFSIIEASFDSSIYDKQKLATSYYESDLYEDAIIIYEEILEIQKNILGTANLNLLGTISKLYELYTLINDVKNAKKYIQEYINIHSSYIIQQQKTYITPLNNLKTIYINEKNPELVHKIDSLLNIINTNLAILFLNPFCKVLFITLSFF